ncbi:MAG: hypothetical protein Q8R72_07430 [Hylemonella sp.]|nr:hypothetical protein [Hylemonella sp.]
MSMKQPAAMVAKGLSALALVLLAACGSTPGGRAIVPEAPMCAIHAVSFTFNLVSSGGTVSPGALSTSGVLVSERTDPNATFASNHGFARFRGIAPPRGNPAVGFTPDVYGFSEAWSRNTSGSVVYRAQAHPARRGTTGPFNASAWTFNTQDAAGRWSPPSRVFSAQRGTEQDSPADGALTSPQLMKVGIASPQVFGCAGERTDDGALRTMWLIEATASNAASGTPGSPSIDFIQDLFWGDDRFVPNAPGPLRGPAQPPSPRLTTEPFPIVREAPVTCAMTQFEDDVSTRELHMVALRNGTLYHSMANNFGTARFDGGAGSAFNRFRTVSPWADVGQALGGGFGNITAVTVVAQPRAVHVLFVAESGGRHRLWHAVRFSGGGGSWRPAADVLATMMAWPQGRSAPFKVAAGLCPIPEDPWRSEVVYMTWSGEDDLKFGRIVSPARPWNPGYQGVYSPLSDLSHLLSRAADASRQTTIHSVSIGTRPFRDDARPPSP